MSDPLASHYDKIISEQETQAQHAAIARDQEEKALAIQALTKLTALAKNEDLAWFIETYLKPLSDKERSKALAPETAALQGPVAANRFEIANEIVTKLEIERARAQATVEVILAREKSGG